MDLRKLEPARKKFSILMPGTPRESQQSAPSSAGPLQVTMYMSELPGNRGFTVSITDLPKGVSLELAGLVKEAALNVRGTVSSSNAVLIDGRPGREGLIKMGNGMFLRMQICSVDDHVFQLQAIGDEAFVKSDDVKKIFDSFKVTP